MNRLRIQVPGHPPRALSPERPILTVGREKPAK